MDLRAMLQAVWNDSLDGIVITDPNTFITDANPAFCRLAGYSKEQVIGQRTNLFRSGLTPLTVYEEMWHELLTSGKWVGELVNLRGDGTLWISYLSITRVTDSNGQIIAYVGLSRDVTGRRELETRLRDESTRLEAVLGSIVSGVAMFDTEGKCVVVNHILTSMLGCTVSDLVGLSREQVSQRLTRLFQPTDLQLPPDPSGQRTIATCESNRRYFAQRWGPVASPTGTPLGEIVTYRDITRETELDRMKSEFIATVSHELRTPMTSVKGALSLVLGGATGELMESHRELLEIAQHNVDRLIRLINDILDLSRIESGRLDLRLRSMDLNAAVRAAAHELEGVRQQRELELKLDLTPNLPAAFGDPDRIHQVLINLLGNAYKFTEPGGRITVGTALAGNSFRVQVADTGPGIRSEELEEIFQRFQRAASQKAGGTGLGLAIARAIVEEHRGKIWAESSVGKGSIFIFSLPTDIG